MLKVKTMPVLLHIVSKIDINPVIDSLKELDLFKDAANGKEAIKQLDRERVGILAAQLISAIIPQFGKIADDVPVLIASYKDVSVAEANEYDAAEVINEIIHDDGIFDFFKRALSHRTERKQ